MNLPSPNVNATVFTGSNTRAAATNKVLRNTYQLLSMTLVFSAVLAWVGMQMNVNPHPIIALIGMIGLLWAVNKNAESSMGLVLTFAFTGWMGFWLAPLMNMVMGMAGGQAVMQALGATGLIFFALSGYVLTTKKDFSFMRGFLFVGMMLVFVTAIGLMIAGMFGVHVPMLSLALSGVCVLLFSGFILYDTSNIIHGGETNYIRATIALYINIYGLFQNLLILFGVMGSDD